MISHRKELIAQDKKETISITQEQVDHDTFGLFVRQNQEVKLADNTGLVLASVISSLVVERK